MRRKLVLTPLPENFKLCLNCYGIFDLQSRYNTDRYHKDGKESRCRTCASNYVAVARRSKSKNPIAPGEPVKPIGFLSYVHFHNMRILRKVFRQELDCRFITAWVPQSSITYIWEISKSENLFTMSLKDPDTKGLVYSTTIFVTSENMQETVESLLDILRGMRVRLEENEVDMAYAKTIHYIYDIDYRTGQWGIGADTSVKEYKPHGVHKVNKAKLEVGEF